MEFIAFNGNKLFIIQIAAVVIYNPRLTFRWYSYTFIIKTAQFIVKGERSSRAFGLT